LTKASDDMSVLNAPDSHTHDLGGTRFTSLATPSRGSAETSVWTVEIDASVPATPHSLTREEVFVVLEGVAAVVVDGVVGVARSGDAIVVPPGVDFQIASGDDTMLRLLCCLPVGGQAVTADGRFTPPWAQ
jgi:mannose-6-phosphate isomerase-like protein (cupin superfamily)